MATLETKERNIRRQLERYGYKLTKGKSRVARAGYGEAGYMILDGETRFIIRGNENQMEYEYSLDKAELNGEQMICEYSGSGEIVGEEITRLFESLANYAGPGWALFNAHFILQTARRMAQEKGLEAVLDSFAETDGVF